MTTTLLKDLRQLTIDAVASPATSRAYAWAWDEYIRWSDSVGSPPFTRATVMKFRTHLESRGLSPSSLNLALSGIRKGAIEGEENRILPAEIAAAINLSLIHI